jgi:hypothetical protein
VLARLGFPSRGDLVILPVEFSGSFKLGKLLLSSGLHRPKSDNFKWPCLSSNRLSGFMSLQICRKNKNMNQYHYYSICQQSGATYSNY